MRKPRLLLMVGAFLAAAVWWQLRIVLPIKATALGFPNYDLYSYYYPTVRFAFDELHHGHLPLWNPYQAAGEPFFAGHQHGLLYPFNGLFLFLPPRLAFASTAVLHLGLALIFGAYLGHTIGLPRGPALLAALTFALGALPQLIYVRTWFIGAIWLPLVVAFTLQLYRRPRIGVPLLGLTVAFTCQYLGGYPMYNLFAAYTVALLAVWESVRLGYEGRWRRAWLGAGGLAAAVLLAGGLSAVQLLPMIEMTALSPRRLGSLALMGMDFFQTARPSTVGSLFVPFALSRYVGAAALPLLIAALVARRHRGEAGFFLALAAAAATLAIGAASPLFRLYQHLPTGNWFRFPGEFAYLVVFGLAYGIGIGADALSARAVPRLRVRWYVPVMLIAAAATLALAPRHAVAAGWLGRVSFGLLMGAGVCGLLVVRLSNPVRWTCVIAVVAFDLISSFANTHAIPDTEPDRFEPAAPLVDFLREHQGLQRTYLHVPPQHAPLAKIGMAHRLYVVADHESLVPYRYAEYLAWAESGAPPSRVAPPQGGVVLDPRHKRITLLDLLGVRYIVTFGDTPFASVDEALRYPVAFRTGDATVFENRGALPRAFVVGTALVTDPPAILSRLTDGGFDLRDTALVEDTAAAVSGAAPQAAEILAYSAERVVIRTQGNTPGLLVLTDQFYPGWRATVDGRPAPIYCADYVFRAVRLGPGAHTVEFVFASPSLATGAWISGGTLVGMLVGAARVCRARHRASPSDHRLRAEEPTNQLGVRAAEASG